MRRRAFIALLAGAAVPLRAQAQQAERVRRIGVLMAHSEIDADDERFLNAFREQLAKLGWNEGRNLRTEFRGTTLEPGEIQRTVRDLIALQPELIVTQSTPTTAALLAQTRTIPVVFTNVSDPVGSGFAASLPRPGGNATGFIDIEGAMGGKWLELLKEIAPRTARAALPFNPSTAPKGGSYFVDPFLAAGVSLAVEAMAAPVRTTAELESVIAAQARATNGGLVVIPDAFLRSRHKEVVALAARYRLPAVYPFRYYSELGGLMSYGNDVADNWRRTASYVDRILKGEQPSALPVQLPVKFELTINLKTAKALGLDVPAQLLARADAVIE